MKKIYIKILALTLIYGILYGVLGEILYTLLAEKISGVLLVMFYFGIMALGLMVILTGVTSREYCPGKIRPKPLKLIIFMLCVCLGSMLLEFLYELEPAEKQRQPASLIFVLDDSGSMEQSDPTHQRIKAVSQVMEEYEDTFSYAVYLFADDYYRARDMKPKSEGNLEDILEPNGGTGIVTVLNGILDDAENGELGQENISVILLSDGDATDEGLLGFGKKNVIKRYKKAAVPVSTIGVGDADESLLQELASETGGSYVGIENASGIREALEAVKTVPASSRNLLKRRNKRHIDFVYAILSVLFLAAIGVGITLVKAESSVTMTYVKKLIPVSLGCVLAGALLMEILMNQAEVFPPVMRVLMCVLFCTTVIEDSADYGNYTGAKYKDKVGV